MQQIQVNFDGDDFSVLRLGENVHDEWEDDIAERLLGVLERIETECDGLNGYTFPNYRCAKFDIEGR